MTAFISAFTLRSGVPTADKDPDDIDYYGVTVSDILAEYPGATVASVTPLLTGVSMPAGEVAFMQGTDVVALIAGGDVTDGAVNQCTFRIQLSNKVRRDRTIAFRMVPK